MQFQVSKFPCCASGPVAAMHCRRFFGPKNGLLDWKFHLRPAFAASFLALIAFLCAITHPFQ